MDDRPARVGDLRSLRRWLLVAAVWATAATTIAVIALITADKARDDNSQAGRESARTAGQIGDAQRRLDRRLDEIEARLDELPSAEDVSDLDSRLGRVQSANGETGEQVEELTGSVDDLETRMESLEENPPDSAAGTETSP
jgi:predicted nuclease with TOPRIM domain